jgi:hypothetical protein
VRTWPSTIFWRAVEKPDIGKPAKEEADGAAGEAKTAPSLVQGSPKRNIGPEHSHRQDARTGPTEWASTPAAIRYGGAGTLAGCLRQANGAQGAATPANSAGEPKAVRAAHFGLCKRDRLCYTLPACEPMFAIPR